MNAAAEHLSTRALASRSAFALEKLRQRYVRIGSAHSPLATILHKSGRAFVAALSLLLLMMVFGQSLNYSCSALAIIVFMTSAQLLSEPPRRANTSLVNWIGKSILQLCLEWLCVVAVILFIGFATHIPELNSARLILAWSIAGPTLILLAELTKWRMTRLLAGATGQQRHIVIGANELAMELNRRTARVGNSTFVGYFDDRSPARLPAACHGELLGEFSDVVNFVQCNAIDAIYISLPVSGDSRLYGLINQLRDTTASVYVLPDVLSFDTIQARVVEIDGLPALSIYDTPFDGTRGLIKRAMDIVMASIALLMIWPLLAAIAVGVKLSSKGPVLFKQHRYGLNGEEIEVYKFRSMTVCENGAEVRQATRFDARITPFGKFLRSTSLDELPQIINVLEGKMSLVGPRPHAVAHNEQYRKLIEGYMFRHKVRPGITGWAQVNGLRGETETIDKMSKRVEYDLDYMRHWSLWMDIKIIFKTIALVFGDSKAY
jgi:putative colanic acid biosynthesis UDP-glucose lipid carrier transferase